MGSCCIKDKQTLKRRTFEIAYNIFHKIALPKQKIINKQSIQQYFQEYSKSCYEILMRQMDFNNDGIITQNQWMAYWEYIRKAGYQHSHIQKQLYRIQKGDINLNFPRTKYYQPNQPRTTLVDGIIKQMKSDTITVSFLTTIPEEQNRQSHA